MFACSRLLGGSKWRWKPLGWLLLTCTAETYVPKMPTPSYRKVISTSVRCQNLFHSTFGGSLLATSRVIFFHIDRKQYQHTFGDTTAGDLVRPNLSEGSRTDTHLLSATPANIKTWSRTMIRSSGISKYPYRSTR